MTTEAKQLPADLKAIIDYLLRDVRAIMTTGTEVPLTAFTLNRKDKLYRKIHQSLYPDKDTFAQAVTRIAADNQSDAIILLSEAWTLPPHLAKDYQAIYDRYGSLANCPDAIEILMVSVETYDGIWFGQSTIETKGRARRADTPVLDDYTAPSTTSEGRFTHLLPPKRPAAH